MKTINTGILVFVVAIVGCGPTTTRSSQPVHQADEELSVLRVRAGDPPTVSVGMPLSSAAEALKAIGVKAIPDRSAHTFTSGTRPRSFILGVTDDGDALFLISDVRPDGTEFVAGLSWHRDWITDTQLAKSERKDLYEIVDSVALGKGNVSLAVRPGFRFSTETDERE